MKRLPIYETAAVTMISTRMSGAPKSHCAVARVGAARGAVHASQTLVHAWNSEVSTMMSSCCPVLDIRASSCLPKLPVKPMNGLPTRSFGATRAAFFGSHFEVPMQTQSAENSATVSKSPIDSLSAVKPRSASRLRTLRATSSIGTDGEADNHIWVLVPQMLDDLRHQRMSNGGNGADGEPPHALLAKLLRETCDLFEPQKRLMDFRHQG